MMGFLHKLLAFHRHPSLSSYLNLISITRSCAEVALPQAQALRTNISQQAFI
jgi:hypothetical protein